MTTSHREPPKPRSSLAQVNDDPAQQAIDGDDADQDADPSALFADRIAVLLQHRSPRDLALSRQLRHVHALTPATTAVSPLTELIDHHALEDPSLVVDITERVLPEDVEDRQRDEEAADAHPETVCESDKGERYNEVGNDGGDEDDERFGG